MIALALPWYFTCVAVAFVVMIARFSPRLSLVEILAGSIVVGTIVPAWIYYLIASIISSLSFPTTVISSFVILIIFLQNFYSFRAKIGPALQLAYSKSERKISLLALLFVFVFLFTLLPLFDTRFLLEKDGIIHSGGSCWADLPIHMHIANSFIHGRNKDISWSNLHSPIFAAERMSYPFLPDFHSAILMYFGASIRSALMYPSIFMAMAFLVLLATFSYRVSRSSLGAIFSVLITCFCGGMGAWHLIKRSGWDSIVDVDVIQCDTSGNYVIRWMSLITHILLPQRGATFSYPMALFIFTLLWIATDATPRFALRITERRTFLISAGVLAASLPLVQAHTFISIGFVVGFMFLADCHKWLTDVRQLWSWILAGLITVTLSYPQLGHFKSMVKTGSGGEFLKYGWWILNGSGVKHTGSFLERFFSFWWLGTGPSFILILVTLGFLIYDVLFAAAAHSRLRAAARQSGRPWSMLYSASVASDGDSQAVAAAAPIATLTKKEKRLPKGSSYPTFSERLFAVVWNEFFDSLGLDPEIVCSHETYSVTTLDQWVAPLNFLSISGRALDRLKLYIAALLLFLMGCYVTFQPWENDNTKLFYVALFILNASVGGLLAAPIELLWDLFLASQPAVEAAISRFTLSTRAGSASTKPTKRRADAALMNADSAALPELCALDAVATVPGDLSSLLSASAADGRGNFAQLKSFTMDSNFFGAGGQQTPQPNAVRKRLAPLGLLLTPVSLALLFFLTLSGFLSFRREGRLFNALFDQDQVATGKFFVDHVPSKAVVLHKNIHITCSGALAGYPSLAGYTGWLWSHGYNYGDRDNDRNFIMDNLLKDDDVNVYNALRRWGVRYVEGESLQRHTPSRARAEYEAAIARGEDPKTLRFNPNLYLNGQLKRIFQSGRFEVFEVLGYPHPPS